MGDQLHVKMDELDNMLNNLNLDIGIDKLELSFSKLLDEINTIAGGISPQQQQAVMVMASSRKQNRQNKTTSQKTTTQISSNSITAICKSVEEAPSGKTIGDEVLKPVFAKLSFKELIRLRLVCKRWNSLINKVICEKKTLKLILIRRGSKEHTKETWFQYCQTTAHKAGYIRTDICLNDRLRLQKYFANATKLDALFICSVDLSPQLKNWSKTLTCLTLRGITKCCSVDKLWTSVNSLNVLRDLRLFHLSIELPCPMPVLSRLEAFSLLGYKSDITPVLAALVPKCKRLSLDQVLCTSYQIYKLMKHQGANNNQFGSSITHLTLGQLFVPETEQKWSQSNYEEVMLIMVHIIAKLFIYYVN